MRNAAVTAEERIADEHHVGEKLRARSPAARLLQIRNHRVGQQERVAPDELPLAEHRPARGQARDDARIAGARGRDERMNGGRGPRCTARSYAARVTGARIHRHHGRLGKKVELRCARPGVGAHRAPDDEIARAQLAAGEAFSAMTSMLSQVGPASTQGCALAVDAQRLDRIARMIVELAAVGAVEAIVEVVPPQPRRAARGR